MKRITCRILIGKYEFKNVVDVAVKSSYETLTDTATLTIPRKLEFGGKQLTGDSGIFKPGDAVKIYLGYDFNNKLIFSGYLSSIKPGTPLELQCEDEMYQLKRGAISKSYKGKVKLMDALKFVLPTHAIECPDISLDIRIDKETPAQVLNNLNRSYGFKSWFRNGTLYVGLAYWPELQQSPPPTFIFSGQRGNIISHDLTFQDAESVRLRVTAISIGKDNKKTEVVVGDPEGENRTLTFFDMDTNELTACATRELERFRFTGYRGTITTFGEPLVRHGDRVEIIDPVIKDRNGLYIAQSVDTSFGVGGYRQQIELGPKVNG